MLKLNRHQGRLRELRELLADAERCVVSFERAVKDAAEQAAALGERLQQARVEAEGRRITYRLALGGRGKRCQS